MLLANLGWVTDERNLKIQLQLGLIFAEAMKDEISQKSREVVKFKVAEKRQPHGGRGPYGLRFVTKAELAQRAVDRGEDRPRRPGNELEREETKLALVRRIFDLLDKNRGQREICRMFQAEGLVTPKGCDPCRKARKYRSCTHWNAAFISAVSREEFYVTGTWYYNKRRGVEPDPDRIRSKGPRHRRRSSQVLRPRSEWMECYRTKPIVTRAQFDRVQAKVAKNKSTNGGRPSDRYLLTTLLKCARCGAAVNGWAKGPGKAWYRCIHRDRVYGHHLCDQKSVRAVALEETVWRALGEEIGDEPKLRAQIAGYEDELTGDVDTGEIEQTRAKAAELRRQLFENADKEIEEVDPRLKSRYGARVKELRPQVEFLEARLRQMERASEQTFKVNTKAIAVKIRAALRTEVRAERRKILRTWVVEILYADGEAEITVRVPLAGARTGDPHRGEGKL